MYDTSQINKLKVYGGTVKVNIIIVEHVVVNYRIVYSPVLRLVKLG